MNLFFVFVFSFFLQDCHQGLFTLLVYISGLVLFYPSLSSFGKTYQLPDQNVCCYPLWRCIRGLVILHTISFSRKVEQGFFFFFLF